MRDDHKLASAELTNWSKSASSPCTVYKASSKEDIIDALHLARTEGLSVIPHGAGHSYTDAALNTSGVVIDLTRMRRILSWDAVHGIMCVEPGVTLHEMVARAWRDGWWPYVLPSSAEITIGGCVAMNVNGRNAWNCGPFGAHVLSLEVLLVSGETLTLDADRDTELLRAFVGSMGLLGILTSITLQLRRLSSGYLKVRTRSARSLREIFSLFAEEEPCSDFMEAWLDGFAEKANIGRGSLTSATLSHSASTGFPSLPSARMRGWPNASVINLTSRLARSALPLGMRWANRGTFEWTRRVERSDGHLRALFPYTFWPSTGLAAYHAFLPEGIETFHAFLPEEVAGEVIKWVMSYSQHEGCLPIWCVMKKHRQDPFLLSYQVNGFSLELNYQRTSRTAERLRQTLQYMVAAVVDAGGKFYLAKDHFLTSAQYRRSIGGEAVDAFLDLKCLYDPETLLQSDLFRRVFQEAVD